MSLARSRPDLQVIATFYPEYMGPRENYIYPDYDSELWETTFDVTEEIIEMGIEEALQIEDNQFSSDALKPEWIDEQHDGPFKIEVEDAIREYFEQLLNGGLRQYLDQ